MKFMTNAIRLLFLMMIVLAAFSCDRMLMQEKRREIGKINLKGLMDTLHLEVASANPLLVKEATIDGKYDTVSMHLNKDEWQKEMGNFVDLKIRPAQLVLEYTEKIIRSDSSIQYQYLSKNPKREDLDSILIMTDSDDKILSLEAFKNDKNLFSTNQQYLKVNFFTYTENAQLPTDYHVSGWQKIRTKDTIRFSVDGMMKY